MGLFSGFMQGLLAPSSFEIAKMAAVAEFDRRQGKTLQIIGWQRKLPQPVLDRFNKQQEAIGKPPREAWWVSTLYPNEDAASKVLPLDEEDFDVYPDHEVRPVYTWI